MKPTRLQKILSSPYIRNVGWMAGAELLNRLIRLSSTVILARMFSPQDYGLMAIVFTISDFANVFSLRGGLGAKIIQSDEQSVSTICNTAYWLNWIACLILFSVQCIAAFLLPRFSYDPQITPLLCFVALSYLSYPLYVVHLVLIERSNQFKITAAINVIASLISNILVATFVLLGLGVWSIVWSMLITSILWIILAWRHQSWRPPSKFSLNRWREVIGFGSNLLINDLLKTLRSNVDYLIIGRYLGIEALGMYYFAFNAGSGITLSLLNTFMTPLYPYICAVRDDYSEFKQRYFSSLKKVSVFLVPLIFLQAALAPIYVPIVFGKKWIPAIPVLILVCISVIPRIYDWSAFLLLSAIDKTKILLMISLTSTVIFIVSILSVVKLGIIWVAFAVLLNSIFVSSGFALWVHRFAFNRKQ